MQESANEKVVDKISKMAKASTVNELQEHFFVANMANKTNIKLLQELQLKEYIIGKLLPQLVFQNGSKIP